MASTKWVFRTTAAVALVGAIAAAAYTTVDGQGRRGAGGFGPPPVGGRGPMGGGRFGGPLGELRAVDLTEAQQTQVRQLMDQHREATQAVREKAMAAHEALRTAIEADTIDEALIRQRSAEAAAIDADLAVSQAHLRQSILQLLTDEQRQKLREARSRIEERRQHRQSRIRERVLQRWGL
jgi:Spy/CpxP family protein refolding chaperone